VFDPPRQPVNVRKMMIYSAIPILDIYALWRIQKFWIMMGISFAVSMIVGLTIGMLLGIGATSGLVEPGPYFYGIGYAVGIPVSLVLVRYFAKRYNQKMPQAQPTG
jgi:hypothetical protein